MLSIKGYLERTEFFRIGKFSARLHRIKDVDRTPFLHTHPFTYLSIVLSGGYTEQILLGGKLYYDSHTVGSFVYRNGNIPHRICQILPGTVTLFFAYYNGAWELFEHPDIHVEGYHDLPDGMYDHGLKYRRRENRRWYTSSWSYTEAEESDRLSIFQNIPATEVRFRHALDSSK